MDPLAMTSYIGTMATDTDTCTHRWQSIRAMGGDPRQRCLRCEETREHPPHRFIPRVIPDRTLTRDRQPHYDCRDCGKGKEHPVHTA